MIYNGYRYRIGAGTGKFSFFQVVSEPVSENFGTGKSLGTGIGKIWYRKKVSEPVSEKFGTEKSTVIGIENIWYQKKSLGIGIVQHFGYRHTLIATRGHHHQIVTSLLVNCPTRRSLLFIFVFLC